jgi:LysM repeat protein
MIIRNLIALAILGSATTLTAQGKAKAKPLTPQEFMTKVNTYLRAQDAAVTEEMKSVRDTLQKMSADMDLQTKTISGVQEKLKELQQELAKSQLENLRLKKHAAKSATKQAALVAEERKARAAGDLKLAAQLAAVIKKTNTMIRETPTTDPPPTNSGKRNYVVQAGDTLGAIAQAFGTTITTIKAANGLKNNTIRIGQKLIIPGKAQ